MKTLKLNIKLTHNKLKIDIHFQTLKLTHSWKIENLQTHNKFNEPPHNQNIQTNFNETLEKKSKILKQKPAKSMIQIQTIVHKYNP